MKALFQKKTKNGYVPLPKIQWASLRHIEGITAKENEETTKCQHLKIEGANLRSKAKASFLIK
jgi:hypothetical protein